MEQEILRFSARFDTTKPIDLDRRFILSYFAVDDTLSVFEIPQRNSGIESGIANLIFTKYILYIDEHRSHHFMVFVFFSDHETPLRKDSD